MEGAGDRANPPHQPTPKFQELKRKSPSDADCKIPQVKFDVGGLDASKSFDGPTRLKHKLAKDAEQLKQLRASCSENQERFLDKMLASYAEAIAILSKFASEEQDQGKGDLISPRPPDDSDNCTLTAASACMVPNLKISEVKPMNYKRKNTTISGNKVTVHASAGFNDDIPDDGFQWRKYGQKVILGSKHPRSYYRCCHRNTQGCLAKKRVQRSDEDPTKFETVYGGKHSCIVSRLDMEESQSSEADIC